MVVVGASVVVVVDVVVLVGVVEVEVFDKLKSKELTSINSSSSVINNRIFKSSSKQHSTVSPLFSSISIKTTSDSDSINITPSSTVSSNFHSTDTSPCSSTEA